MRLAMRLPPRLLSLLFKSPSFRPTQLNVAPPHRAFAVLPAKPNFTISHRYAKFITCMPRFFRCCWPYSSALGAAAEKANATPAFFEAAKNVKQAAISFAANSAPPSWQRPSTHSVSFVSAPFSGGQPKSGAECGPDAIFAGQINTGISASTAQALHTPVACFRSRVHAQLGSKRSLSGWGLTTGTSSHLQAASIMILQRLPVLPLLRLTAGDVPIPSSQLRLPCPASGATHRLHSLNHISSKESSEFCSQRSRNLVLQRQRQRQQRGDQACAVGRPHLPGAQRRRVQVVTRHARRRWTLGLQCGAGKRLPGEFPSRWGATTASLSARCRACCARTPPPSSSGSTLTPVILLIAAVCSPPICV